MFLEFLFVELLFLELLFLKLLFLNMSVFELWKVLLLWSGIGIVSKLTSKRVMLEVTSKNKQLTFE